MACSSDNDTENWHEKTFAETNIHMLEGDILCDVTFLVGKKREPVRAHRFMLASRSPVFYAMFCGPLAENQEAIPVPDVDIDIFKMVLRFIYMADCTLTGETVMPTLYAAKKYGIAMLVKTCLHFLQGHVDEQNVCTILQQCVLFDEKDMVDRSLSYIFENGQKVLESEGFLSLEREALQIVIESGYLEVDELVVYNACVSWAKQQCTKGGIATSDENVREALGDLVYLIRFPIMSLEDFAEHVSQTDILTADEKVDLYHRFILNTDLKHKFLPKPRSVDLIFERFESVGEYYIHNGKAISISFTCSRNVRLYGVYLFAPSEEGGWFGGEFAIADDKKTLWKAGFVFTYEPNKTRELVVRKSPLKLKKDKKYFLIQKSSGAATYFGKNGKAEVAHEHVQVTFSRSYLNKCRQNNVHQGQICGLHFV